MSRAVYQKLSYIANKTNEVVDLEYNLKGSIGFDISFVNFSASRYTYTSPFGARDVSSGNTVGVNLNNYANSNNQSNILYGTSYSREDSYSAPTSGTFKLTKTSSTRMDAYHSGTWKAYFTVSDFEYDISLYLYAIHEKSDTTDGLYRACTGRITYCKIYDNGTLVRDLIPVKRLSDGICGFLDTVSKKMFIAKSGNTAALSGEVPTDVIYYDSQGNEVDSLETLSEKLTNIKETKDLIKQAIVDKGVEVSDTDTFRSYAEKIENIETGSSVETYESISVGGLNSPQINFGYGYAGLIANNIDFTDDLINGTDENRTAVTLENGSSIELRVGEEQFVDALIAASQDEGVSEENRFTNYIGLTPEKIVKGNTILGVEGAHECSSDEGEQNIVYDKTSALYFYKQITEIKEYDCEGLTTTQYLFSSLVGLTKIGSIINTDSVLSMSYMFKSCSNLTTVPLFVTSSVTNMNYMFSNCITLTEVPLFDTSSVTNMDYMFQACSALTEIPLFDTNSVTSMYAMFQSCSALTEIPQLDTSSVTNTNTMFRSCTSLTEVPQLDTSSVINITSMFYNCTSLIEVPELDCGNVVNISTVFYMCKALTTLGGLKDLGKAYTQQSANYSNYTLSLSFCSNLTHDSLMNVINGLYDLNLTYDVENGGTLYTQSLVLGDTLLAKLTEEEIAIATVKGWTVS